MPVHTFNLQIRMALNVWNFVKVAAEMKKGFYAARARIRMDGMAPLFTGVVAGVCGGDFVFCFFRWFTW
jgi:hypothetical protein